MPLPGTAFELWRWCAIRGAGFAAAEVLRLAAPDSAAAADRLLDVELERARVQRAAHDEVARAQAQCTTQEERKILARANKKLALGAIPVVPAPPVELERALARLRQLDEERTQEEATLERVFEAGSRRTRAVLLEISRDPRFREALLWQNPKLLSTAVESLARYADDFGWKARRDELLLASYLQRYALKNDTIGFFGPVGWARLSEANQPLRFAPGRSLLAARTVFFEPWLIDALAQGLADDPELAPDLAPRPSPRVRLEGNVAVLPVDRRVELPPEYARLLAACDGATPARAIATALLADGALGVDDEADVFSMLEDLVNRQLAIWSLELPYEGAHAERSLRAQLEALPPSPARARALGSLERLELALAEVARAVGDPAKLAPAIAAFQVAADQEVSVARGRTRVNRAAREGLYEDCRRDLALELGTPLLTRIAPALGMVLDSARWFLHAVAQRYRARLEADYRALAPSGGPVEYLRLFERAQDCFASTQSEPPALVADAARKLRSDWAELLGVTPPPETEERRGEREPGSREPWRIQLASATLAPRATERFAAPHAAWPSARHLCPDLLIAADSAEAIARGDYRVVLGELHVGLNSLMPSLFFEQHPNKCELDALQRADRDGPQVTSVVPRAFRTRALQQPTRSPDQWEIETGDVRSALPRDHVLAVADLVVDQLDDRVVVRARDRRVAFDLMVFFEQHLVLATATHFALLPPASRLPRVTVDELVVQRESWHFTADELGFAHEDSPVGRFLAARRWARAHGLPRFSFYKLPEEPKPIHLDLDSPTLVEVLARHARRASQLTVTEMLPVHDQLWLSDAEGRRYTSELRFVAVDQRRYPVTRS